MKITLVQGEDWVGLYVDGKLKNQGHSLSPFEVCDALGVDNETVWADEHLKEHGYCPPKLEDVTPDPEGS